MCVVTYLLQPGVELCVGVICFWGGCVVMEFDLDSLDPLRLAVVLCWVDRCFGSWVLLAYSVFSKYHNHPRTNVVTSCCYKRVKGRSHTVEKRISMLPHKPHATSCRFM